MKHQDVSCPVCSSVMKTDAYRRGVRRALDIKSHLLGEEVKYTEDEDEAQ